MRPLVELHLEAHLRSILGEVLIPALFADLQCRTAYIERLTATIPIDSRL